MAERPLCVSAVRLVPGVCGRGRVPRVQDSGHRGTAFNVSHGAVTLAPVATLAGVQHMSTATTSNPSDIDLCEPVILIPALLRTTARA